MSRQSALNFEPGHEYSYSNTGFNLLAIVVSRVSGMSFAEFSTKRIFEPLGMANTQWRDDYTRIVKGRSSAYSVEDGQVRIMRPIENVHGNGGILTTVSDLLVWNRALTEGRLGGAEFRKLMLEQGVLNRRTSNPLRFRAQGIDVRGVCRRSLIPARRPAIELSWAAFQSRSFRLPCCVTPRTSGRGETGGKIARAFLGNAAHDPAAPVEVAVPVEELSKKAGLYRDTRNRHADAPNVYGRPPLSGRRDASRFGLECGICGWPDRGARGLRTVVEPRTAPRSNRRR